MGRAARREGVVTKQKRGRRETRETPLPCASAKGGTIRKRRTPCVRVPKLWPANSARLRRTGFPNRRISFSERRLSLRSAYSPAGKILGGGRTPAISRRGADGKPSQTVCGRHTPWMRPVSSPAPRHCHRTADLAREDEPPPAGFGSGRGRIQGIFEGRGSPENPRRRPATQTQPVGPASAPNSLSPADGWLSPGSPLS